MTIRQGDKVRVLADAVSDDGRRVPAGTSAGVAEVFGDAAAFDLDLILDGQPDTLHVTAEQVEPAE